MQAGGESPSVEGIDWLFTGFHEADLIGVPIAYDPGTDFVYSNFTAHLLGIIVARSCGTDLKTFAGEHLF